ncbi:hypothetical protein GCM10012287_43760 [Streptomyces daqingensis]|uniref:Ferritin-like domain-containing protein n=1 Tax=Streptomyces daqingensis TaxID=1472640 RepID=A0ABQ2MN40_9ACTN|nr:ferritin-like domain-containing protein [Streptomyces daqingensis]GGO54549.1 hypothetical protein GCM10012287_43760 [Streptomyces daqingensis]
MLSSRSLFREILDNDRSFQLFCSIAASGEAQGGWENARIAALVPESMRPLVPKITKHGKDEEKHGRIFNALLKKRGLEPVEVPPETDYTMLLERRGIGLMHEKLRRDRELSEEDIVIYLAHSRVTEDRAAAQMAMLLTACGDDVETSRAIRMISNDEDAHLAYCHEELLRLIALGHGEAVGHHLRESALAEISVHRQVSLAVMSHMGNILQWPAPKSAALAAAIHALYAFERAGGWRRHTELKMPEMRNALGEPASAAPVL